MIAVHDFTNGTTTEYAENNREFVDSIFTPGGTLAVFKKIQNRKNDVLYFVDDDRGYFERKADGLFGKFGTLENGKKFFQWTTEKITRK